jgi:REP element-mobilizing transposase RayT
LWRIAKEALKYPAVELSGVQARAVARGISAILPKVGLIVHACAIMPDHVHLVVPRHGFDGNELIACVKRAGTRGLNNERLNPMQDYPRENGKLPSPWGGRGWKVKLYTVDEIRAAIRYVEQNPIRAGFKRQNSAFVVSYGE